MSFVPDLVGRVESGHEREAIRIAAAQDGVIAARQLVQAGFSKPAIRHRVNAELLRRVHQGVYVYGPVTGPRWEEWAALLACGARAVLSHGTSLALDGLRDRPAIVHVIRPSATAERRGVLIHRGKLRPDEIRIVHGLRATSPLRTIQDLAPSMPAVELARLIEEMQVRGLIDHVEPVKNRPGAPKLRAVLAQAHEPSLTRSEAERRLLGLIRAARLPQPQTNVRVGRHEVDMLWRDQRVIVEIDGFAFHSSRAAFERDRARDAELQALGYRVLRITWRRLVNEPEAVIALLAGALSAAKCA
jgi:very-short-patch-repair endonuclease